MTCGAREHVVPLKDLVEQDAVDEAAEAQAHDQRRCLRRRIAAARTAPPGSGRDGI
jgi:hypothetical protein